MSGVAPRSDLRDAVASAAPRFESEQSVCQTTVFAPRNNSGCRRLAEPELLHRGRGRPSHIPKFANARAETGFDRECVSSNPLTPARQSSLRPRSPRNGRIGRKRGLFTHPASSPGAQIGNLGAAIAESLRPSPQIFPFAQTAGGDWVRSRLPPARRSQTSAVSSLGPPLLGVVHRLLGPQLSRSGVLGLGEQR